MVKLEGDSVSLHFNVLLCKPALKTGYIEILFRYGMKGKRDHLARRSRSSEYHHQLVQSSQL